MFFNDLYKRIKQLEREVKLLKKASPEGYFPFKRINANGNIFYDFIAFNKKDIMEHHANEIKIKTDVLYHGLFYTEQWSYVWVPKEDIIWEKDLDIRAIKFARTKNRIIKNIQKREKNNAQ